VSVEAAREAALLLFNSVHVTVGTIRRISFECTQAWDLGNNWGFSYLLGAYLDVDSEVAWSSTSLNQRFALSYTGGH
jgi:hypothetical protein